MRSSYPRSTTSNIFLADTGFFFFDHFDAIGVSRYLPLLVYVKGRPDQAAYIGHAMESYERDLGKFWAPTVLSARGSLDAAQLATDYLAKLGPS